MFILENKEQNRLRIKSLQIVLYEVCCKQLDSDASAKAGVLVDVAHEAAGVVGEAEESVEDVAEDWEEGELGRGQAAHQQHHVLVGLSAEIGLANVHEGVGGVVGEQDLEVDVAVVGHVLGEDARASRRVGQDAAHGAEAVVGQAERQTVRGRRAGLGKVGLHLREGGEVGDHVAGVDEGEGVAGAERQLSRHGVVLEGHLVHEPAAGELKEELDWVGRVGGRGWGLVTREALKAATAVRGVQAWPRSWPASASRVALSRRRFMWERTRSGTTTRNEIIKFIFKSEFGLKVSRHL